MRAVERNHLPVVQEESAVPEVPVVQEVQEVQEAACYPEGVAERFLAAAVAAYQSCVLPRNSFDALATMRERYSFVLKHVGERVTLEVRENESGVIGPEGSPRWPRRGNGAQSIVIFWPLGRRQRKR